MFRFIRLQSEWTMMMKFDLVFSTSTDKSASGILWFTSREDLLCLWIDFERKLIKFTSDVGVLSLITNWKWTNFIGSSYEIKIKIVSESESIEYRKKQAVEKNRCKWKGQNRVIFIQFDFVIHLFFSRSLDK